MWEERYSAEGYLFGTEPAEFLVRQADLLAPEAEVLMVADGEGRNSVFLAARGLSVTAADASPVGVAKAKKLAEERGVDVEFKVADFLEWDWRPEAFDAVVAIFIQFLDPAQRSIVFDGMKRTLRPGGRLLLHGYRPEQLAYGTGGPPVAENLYTEKLLADAFADMKVEVLKAYDATITEGTGHDGMSALIDLVAVKL